MLFQFANKEKGNKIVVNNINNKEILFKLNKELNNIKLFFIFKGVKLR